MNASSQECDVGHTSVYVKRAFFKQVRFEVTYRSCHECLILGPSCTLGRVALLRDVFFPPNLKTRQRVEYVLLSLVIVAVLV